MRKLIGQALHNTPAMQAIIAKRIYHASSLGHGNVPALPKKPFMVYRELDRIATNIAKDTAPDNSIRIFQFYIHDEKGGYTRIDQIDAILRETVRGLIGQTSPSGARCTDAVWNGSSGDTEDPTYDSNLKIATLTLISSS